MKKAKIMLSALAVVAVVGSSLAFKTKGTLFFWHPQQGTGICISDGLNYIQDDTGTPAPQGSLDANTPAHCTFTTITTSPEL